MKIVFLASLYESYLPDLERRHPEAARMPYAERMAMLVGDCYPVWPAYYSSARELGHDSSLIVPNWESTQRQWALENDVRFSATDWRMSIAAEQIRRLAPDVLFMGSMFDYYGAFLDAAAPHCKLRAGWLSCPRPPRVPLRQMDILLTSVEALAEEFRREAITSEVVPASFDQRVLERLPRTDRDIDFSFVGSVSAQHSNRRRQLEELARKLPLKWWGPPPPAGSRVERIRGMFAINHLAAAHQGEAWALEMYRVLGRSRITFNSHIDFIAGQFAGNMRMFEATGTGALLLTEAAPGIEKLFVPGKEVITYEGIEDACEKATYYLAHEDERASVAAAGKSRTLSDHRFEDSVALMLRHLENALRRVN